MTLPLAASLFGMSSDYQTIGLGESPLLSGEIYTEEGLATLSKILEEKKYGVNQGDILISPLARAIHTKKHTAVALLLENGADSNLLFNKISPNNPLNLCITFGTPEITELLLQHNANPNSAIEYCHPLFSACNTKHFGKHQLKNLAVLLRSGINIFAKHKNQTIFQYLHTEFEGIQQKLVDLKWRVYLGREKQETLAVHSDLVALYKKAARSLAEYKKLALQLRSQRRIPVKICHLILCAVDFGLDDYHAVKAQ